MPSDEENIGLNLRISGRIYSADSVITQVHNLPVSPSQWNKVGANFLALVLVLTMNLLGYEGVDIVWVLAALFAHEFGHYIGMLATRSNTASFAVGIFGPLALGTEGLSAGRKAMVALSGSIAGLVVAASLSAIASILNLSTMSPFINALVFVSALNMIPVKPFDGYAVVDHLVFLRHPKVRLIYLIMMGVLMLFLYMHSFYRHDHPFYAFFFIALLWCMFGGAKKADNMADMVVRLRKEGVKDFEQGKYRPETVKRMEFSLNLFDVSNEVILAGLLREIWEQAWEIPASKPEVVIVLAMYVLMLISCMSMPVVEQICSVIF